MALVPRIYDTLLEPLVGGFRVAGLRLVNPEPGTKVLDVGCGTGTHLALYAKSGCTVAGVDLNPDMIARARSRLGPGVDLREADATDLPFDTDAFDLAIGMLMLHEIPPADRKAVLGEMARVAQRVLIIDHHPRPARTLRGRAIRAAATSIEWIAGGDHYRNYRQFLQTGGVPAVVAGAGRGIIASTREASGSMGLYLLG
ncbi:MAG: class I SAM-dependent methyltransferase [Acidimicrobiia bacterium]|nr:class I SAM-dependent methyltransferase [Acidimicrobiia bacterium]